MSEVLLLNNPLKTVLIEGVLTINKSRTAVLSIKSTLEVRLALDYLDIRIGTWSVALKDVIILSSKKPKRLLRQFLNVSINIVDGKKLNSNHCVQNFNPPIQRIEYNSSSEKFTTFHEILWYTINCPTTLLEIYFEFWPELKPEDIEDEKLELKVFATLLFRRMR